jgi:hypothetical protein
MSAMALRPGDTAFTVPYVAYLNFGTKGAELAMERGLYLSQISQDFRPFSDKYPCFLYYFLL